VAIALLNAPAWRWLVVSASTAMCVVRMCFAGGGSDSNPFNSIIGETISSFYRGAIINSRIAMIVDGSATPARE